MMPTDTFYHEQQLLENDLVALVPFDPTIHAERFVEVTKANRNLFSYIPFPNIDTKEEFLDFYFKHIGPLPGECLYAIFDKTNNRASRSLNVEYAGTMALSRTSLENAATEIGVLIFPGFQRTHVATNAIGLLLLWVLDPPSAGGLGLRRVEWKTHSENIASRKAAERLEFELEGIARWERVFPGGEIALPVDALQKRNGTRDEHPGRHTAIYSIVWDEWDEKRNRVVALLNRLR